MTSIDELPDGVRARVPADISAYYEVHEWRNAIVIFKNVHSGEWNDLLEVLRAFRLNRSEVIRGGGN